MDQRITYLFRGLSATKWDSGSVMLFEPDRTDYITSKDRDQYKKYKTMLPRVPYTHYRIYQETPECTVVSLVCFNDPRNPDYVISCVLVVSHSDTNTDNVIIRWYHRISPHLSKITKNTFVPIPEEYRRAFDIQILDNDREKDKQE